MSSGDLPSPAAGLDHQMGAWTPRRQGSSLSAQRLGDRCHDVSALAVQQLTGQWRRPRSAGTPGRGRGFLSSQAAGRTGRLFGLISCDVPRGPVDEIAFGDAAGGGGRSSSRPLGPHLASPSAPVTFSTNSTIAKKAVRLLPSGRAMVAGEPVAEHASFGRRSLGRTPAPPKAAAGAFERRVGQDNWAILASTPGSMPRTARRDHQPVVETEVLDCPRVPQALARRSRMRRCRSIDALSRRWNSSSATLCSMCCVDGFPDRLSQRSWRRPRQLSLRPRPAQLAGGG